MTDPRNLSFRDLIADIETIDHQGGMPGDNRSKAILLGSLLIARALTDVAEALHNHKIDLDTEMHVGRPILEAAQTVSHALNDMANVLGDR